MTIRLLIRSTVSPKLLSLVASVLLVCPEYCAAQRASARISSGGIDRYNGDRWGVVQGQFRNDSERDQTVTAVVTQKGFGNQYSGAISVPAGVSRNVYWPIYVERPNTDAFEFEYFVLNESDGRETVTRRKNEQLMRNFVVSGIQNRHPERPGFCGQLYTSDTPEPQTSDVDQLLEKLRHAADFPSMLRHFEPHHVRGYSEAFEPLDQLALTSPELWKHPETCDAIRLWLQRGGRALLMLDLVGQESAKAVLGDSLPFTIVDRTYPRHLNFKFHRAPRSLNPSDPSYTTTLDEPVPLDRVIPEGGIVHWSHEGWPVLIEVAVGNGSVYLACMSARAFLADNQGSELAPNAEVLVDGMFRAPAEKPIISGSDLATVAEYQVGYSIPTRTFPFVVLALFLTALGIVGWLLKSRGKQSWLMVGAPVCATLAMIPGLATGLMSRNAAPTTLIETRIINASNGQTTLAADGIASVYFPGAQELHLDLHDHTSVRPARKSKSAARQRLTWTDVGSSFWPDFSQPAGISNYPERSVLRLEKPLKTKVSFVPAGLSVELVNAGQLTPQDAIIAGPGPDRMLARTVSERTFLSTPDDILIRGQFGDETMLSEEQVRRKTLYQAVFADKDRSKPFPPVPSLLFWSDTCPSSIGTRSEELRKASSTLVVLPLDIQPPELDQTISIPATLLPYVSIPDENGAVSPAFGNRNRNWIQRKNGGEIVLKFYLPRSCLPFCFQGASLKIRLRAGSRSLNVQAGSLGAFNDVKRLHSPVGQFTIELPVKILNDTSSEFVFVKLQVGELELEADDESAFSEQDNFWKMDRVLLTVNGYRTISKSQDSEDNSL